MIPAPRVATPVAACFYPITYRHINDIIPPLRTIEQAFKSAVPQIFHHRGVDKQEARSMRKHPSWRIILLVTLCAPLTAIPRSHPHTQNSTRASPQPLQTGPYFALIIGNDNYLRLAKLQTAISDADAVARLLREKFGFKTQVLHDATRGEIFRALNEYRRALSNDSNLLIYYAGHGHHDLDTDTAYWLPADADPDLDTNWISANDITHEVRAIPSQHVLIVSDSCYSGAIAKNSRSIVAGISPRDRHIYLNKLLNSRSRNLMASGGDEPVTDKGSGNHSIFAAVFLRSLIQIDDDNFTAADLFYEFIRPAVGGGSRQLPEYDILRDSGHEAGDFIFSHWTPSTISAEPVVPPKVEPQALHIQRDQALAETRNAQESASENEKKQLAEAEEKERATAKAEFPKQIFDMVKGTWGYSKFDASINTTQESTLTFKDLDTSRGVLTFSLEYTGRTSVQVGSGLGGLKTIVGGRRYGGYFTPNPPNRLQGTSLECRMTETKAAVKGVFEYIPCSAPDDGFTGAVVLVLSQDQLKFLIANQELLFTHKSQ